MNFGTLLHLYELVFIMSEDISSDLGGFVYIVDIECLTTVLKDANFIDEYSFASAEFFKKPYQQSKKFKDFTIKLCGNGGSLEVISNHMFTKDHDFVPVGFCAFYKEDPKSEGDAIFRLAKEIDSGNCVKILVASLIGSRSQVSFSDRLFYWQDSLSEDLDDDTNDNRKKSEISANAFGAPGDEWIH